MLGILLLGLQRHLRHEVASPSISPSCRLRTKNGRFLARTLDCVIFWSCCSQGRASTSSA